MEWRTESGDLSGASSTTGSASASGRDGASASAASCSTAALGPEASLELLPCAALVFNTQGQLMGVNSKAAGLYSTGEHGVWRRGGARATQRARHRPLRGAPAVAARFLHAQGRRRNQGRGTTWAAAAPPPHAARA